MIRTVKIPRLGCAPGGSCCSSCSSGKLGDVSGQMGDTSTGLLITFSAIIGGFLLAAAASGKLGKGKDGR